MIEIQPQHLSVDQLLYGRLFRIPQYQRTYSWLRKQRQELFHDIRSTWEAGEERTHFMATVVGLRREKRTIMAKEHQVIELVDGQQRITTLILLLKAIAKNLDRSEPEAERIGQDLDETLVKPDKASLLLLQTNHDTSNYFADYLREGIHPPSGDAKTLADRELLRAIEDCEEFVSEWREMGCSLEALVSLLKNRLTFVFHEIGDEGSVYTVFEVLNSRGLDVSWFDRLKSMLMAIVFEDESGNKAELIEEVHQLWTDIYRCVGLRLGLSTESLRFAATLRLKNRPNRALSEEDAAHFLRDQSLGGPEKVLETTRWVKSVTEAVDCLVADRRRNAVTSIAQARLVATAVNLRSDLTDDEKEQILHRWENITFRIYGMGGKDARTAVGDYVRLAWRIIRGNLSYTRILAALSNLGDKVPIDEAVKNLSKTDCYYGWQEQLRYFFFRYEEYKARKLGQNFDNEQWNRIWESSASDSIEHIRPQSTTNADWKHWLGNLLVLPPKLNSQLGAKLKKLTYSDEYKKSQASAYNGIGLLVAQEVVDKLSGWGRKAIEEREEQLLEWARQEWG